ncbi:PTS system, N-acetylglucosamine-specific IIBC subunit (plasmid) [Gemmatirosa kalamazoonensis]|uniref:PTS system, N-acetylglucosamine-specific IIBC subunit n=1 Tax=Gemmatirosa kalamazoonensis TaxID=861299 RepID=W0RPZ0_9BACT|nr:N-acetylglucosamine-specific PTS transporter subunit IIBC [Gemmatirosa kalamazoonensis]AHG92552.1 PTS system, N-acetylglucosamine-specific IIBC subunit [Gemmatirosa kalamazoonensis]
MKRWIEATQPLGRALMLPIAVLPAAALLLRLGQGDLLNLPFVAAAGNAIFSNLGLLFAIGVAVGLARENHGAAGLAGVVGYLIATEGAKVLIAVPPTIGAGLAKDAADAAVAAFKSKELSRLSVPIGIISGLIAGWLYNRYKDIKLPNYLAFFGGRRFVPIAAGFAGLVVAAAFGFGWPVLTRGMDAVSNAVVSSGPIGLFVYGLLNRILIVTGLHHIINNVAWFLVGSYHGVTGDLNRFFAGDPTAGAFMSGFFPVMMFGLPAACLAMYRTALPARRAAVGGMLLSLALTSFLTGVTEPIEFSFMFLAPALYALHAVLTGAALVTMDLINSKLGFGFSAGLFDYVLNFNKSTNPLLLWPVGLVYFALYYGLFRWAIVRFDLKTPGRELEEDVAATTAAASAPTAGADDSRAGRFITALGGPANLRTVDACATRLRLTVNDQGAIDERTLRGLGASGTMKVGANGLQVVLGPIADLVAGEIRDRLHELPRRAATPPAPAAAPVPASAPAATDGAARVDGELAAHASDILAALGGPPAVRSFEAAGGRVLVTVVDGTRIDEAALRTLGVRGVARPSRTSVHLLHADPDALARALNASAER